MKSFPTERMYNIIDTPKYKAFASGRVQDFWPASPQVSVLFKDLFQGMFRQDPSSRATLDQITSHPWLNGDLPSKDEITAEIARLYAI